jgi:hypothetical protein
VISNQSIKFASKFNTKIAACVYSPPPSLPRQGGGERKIALPWRGKKEYTAREAKGRALRLGGRSIQDIPLPLREGKGEGDSIELFHPVLIPK